MTRRDPDRAKYVKIVCDALASGESLTYAVALTGLARQTFYRWMDESSDISDAVKKAEAKGRAEMIGAIRKAANDGTWQAAAWWLERRFPDEWGRRLTIKLRDLRAEALDLLADDADLDPNDLLDEAEAVIRDAAT